MYEFATEDQQKYKEGKVILERNLVNEMNGIEELVPNDLNDWNWKKWFRNLLSGEATNVSRNVTVLRFYLATLWALFSTFYWYKYRMLLYRYSFTFPLLHVRLKLQKIHKFLMVRPAC